MTRLTIADVAGKATISVPEAGQVLDIGRDAAYAAAERGEIPVLRLGRSLRVPVPKLLRLLGVSGPENSDAAASPPRHSLSQPTTTTTKRLGHSSPEDRSGSHGSG
jgi:excisionase family DNA binding protein